LRATAGTNQFAVKQKLDGISIQPLLKDLLGKDPLEGRGSVSLDLQTQGATVSALKKALAGQAALSLSDGAVNGINVAKLLREVKAGLSNKSVTTTASAVEKTDFSALSASFRIAGGVAHNDDLKLTSPFLRMSGGGDIDIANERIDYLAKVSVVNTSTGQQGKSLAVLKGVTVPLRLRGPFSELAYSLELGDLVEDLAKAKLDENKEQIKAKVVEKLGDQLKGLFGR
jgi:AsmA protein